MICPVRISAGTRVLLGYSQYFQANSVIVPQIRSSKANVGCDRLSF
jgi:hypothetical protein